MKEIQKNPSFGKMGNYTKQFHTTLSTPFFLNQSRTRIMESYWCSQKNDIVNLNDGKTSDLVLIPCRKGECAVWRGGECSHIRKVGNQSFRE